MGFDPESGRWTEAATADAELYPPLPQRYLATVIDLALVYFVVTGLWLAIQGTGFIPSWIHVLGFIVILLLYEPIGTSNFCTLGQRITGIRIRSSDGAYQIDLTSAIFRSISKLVLAIPSLFVVFTNRRRRALHDLIVGSTAFTVQAANRIEAEREAELKRLSASLAEIGCLGASPAELNAADLNAADLGLTAEQQLARISDFVRQEMERGWEIEALESRLLELGLDRDALAAAIAATGDPALARKMARRKVKEGSIWLLGGLFVTFVSFSSASPGETYIITWGAVLYGLVRLFQGLRDIDSRTESEDSPVSNGSEFQKEGDDSSGLEMDSPGAEPGAVARADGDASPGWFTGLKIVLALLAIASFAYLITQIAAGKLHW